MKHNFVKARLVYIVVIFIVIVLGISSRTFSDQLPLFVSRHFGDALWASMLYFMFRELLAKQKLWIAFILSLLFSFGIEFSQLYQAGWINGIRSTLIGGLILGKGFLWIDLVRYTLGVVLSFGMDQYLARRLHVHK